MNDYKTIENITTGIERAFYKSTDTLFKNCEISGIEDGESAFKESKNIKIDSCKFLLRYPFWHNNNLKITNSSMSDTCRAALWYSNNIDISNCIFDGIKVLRECINININNTTINSKECFWMCTNANINDSTVTSEYPFFYSRNINLNNFTLNGKYSFQYCKDIVINNSYLDTKDAFWESENITLTNCTIKGEYLAWYSKNLKLINCTIIGTQPLCYCKNLIIENCKMIDCDLSFEYSEVNATIIGEIESIKNPLKGKIIYESCKEIITDENFINEGIEIIKKYK